MRNRPNQAVDKPARLTESVDRDEHIDAESFETTLLTADHDIARFDSGEPETDTWLARSAWRAQQQGSARTRVLTRPGQRRVLGFYAVVPHDTHRAGLPSAAAGGLRVVPGYLIAQLAVDRSLQGRGMGAALLLDALETIAAAARTVGGRLVVVDAVTDAVLRFYERYGFVRIGQTRRLYLKISRIESSLSNNRT